MPPTNGKPRRVAESEQNTPARTAGGNDPGNQGNTQALVEKRGSATKDMDAVTNTQIQSSTLGRGKNTNQKPQSSMCVCVKTEVQKNRNKSMETHESRYTVPDRQVP